MQIVNLKKCTNQNKRNLRNRRINKTCNNPREVPKITVGISIQIQPKSKFQKKTKTRVNTALSDHKNVTNTIESVVYLTLFEIAFFDLRNDELFPMLLLLVDL